MTYAYTITTLEALRKYIGNSATYIHGFLLIAEAGESGIRPSTLAGMMDIAPSTVTRMVYEINQYTMEDLVGRRDNFGQSPLVLTELGKDLLKRNCPSLLLCVTRAK